MNIKRKLLFLIISLLMTFLLPNYAMASLTGNVPDGAKTHAGSRVNICYKKEDGSFVTMNISTGRLKSQRLHDQDEFFVNGKCGTVTPPLQCPTGKVYNKTSNSCVTPATGNVDAPTILDDNGELLDFSAPVLISGTAKAVNAVYKYDNIITINGIQVDALIKITGATSSSVTTFDRNDPNGGSPYKVSSGASVSDAKFFAPEITTTAAQGRVDFLITFQDISGNPVTLLNVYGNTIDIDGMGNIGQSEFVEYGGFVSYELASNTDLTAQIGSDGIKRKFVGKGGYGGLTLNDIGRVQTKFDSISILEISMGSTWKSGLRLYGTAFVKHNLTSPVTHTPPTVNSQTTTNTKPPITGGKGSSATISSIAVKNSADITTTLAGSLTYPTATTWQFIPTSPLAVGTYDVIATGSNGLVDQTDDELTILLSCTSPLVLNATGTACEPVPVCTGGAILDTSTNTCVPPTIENCPTLEPISANIPSYALSESGKKVTICHLTSSATNPFVVITISTNALDTHLDNHGDYFSKTGACPTDAVPCPPLVCTLPAVLNQAGDACIVPDPPTARDATTTDLVPVPLDGDIGTHRTISSVILTKTKDGLGATATGTTTVAGTPLTIASGATTWTISSGAVPVGTYTITVKDGYNLTGTGTLTVTCPTGKVATATTCIAPLAPEVHDKSTTEGTPVPLTGKPGSSLTISSVTLTKFKDGLGTAVGGSPVTVGNNITSGQTLWTTPTPSAMVQTVGQYTITATDGNGKTGTNVLTVTCPAGKITTAASCIQSTAPTVIEKKVKEKDPIKLEGGTVGSVALDNSETFTVQVNGKTYTKGDGNLTVTDLTWTLNIPSTDLTTILAANSPYDVVATRSGTLKDSTTGELTIEALSPPTVESQTTFDTTPVIEGTVGTVALETGEAFTVSVNGKTYTNGVDTNLVVSGTNWTLTILTGNEIPGKATPYDVVATRGTAPDAKTGTGQLTITPCALPKVVNAAKTACIDPVPTVVKQTINSNTAVAPVITGTVGEVALGSTETFSVTIKTTTPQVYAHATPETELKVTGTNWTLTVPSNKAISAGTYDVDAARNTSAKDATSGELVINLVCNTDETNVNGVCAPKAYSPTVETLITDDTTPVITGTVGTSVLAAGETFTVTVNGVLYPHPTVTGLEWSVQIPIENALNVGAYPVEATRGDLTGKGTVTITQCASPKVVNATTGDCSEPSLMPTVTPSASHNIKDPSIVIAGTVGDIELTSQEKSENAFSVKVHNAEHSDVKGALLVSGINWTFTLTERFIGTFDVDAKRGSKIDITDGELTITGGSCCINGVTTQCPTTISIPNYTGECSIPVCPNTDAAGNCTSPLPDKDKEETLPSQPTSKIEEAIKPPADLGYCDDGGKRSYGESMSGITIKRARIANAETIGGTFESNALVGMHVMYGTLTAGSYEDNDHSCEQGYCVNKTITGATLTGAFVDIANDYVNAAGTVIDSNNRGIALTGGVTNPTSFRKDGVTPINATITNGMITAGTDGAGNPVRGSITNGLFADPITHVSSVLTKGRRTQGTLTNATISGATITTVNGVSVVGCDRSLDSTHTPCTVGVIVSGTMDSTGVKTFGTVENATLTGATILNSNHCFSSGTVGSKGQLNWKEVVK